MTKKRWIGAAATVTVLMVCAAAAALGCGGEDGNGSRVWSGGEPLEASADELVGYPAEEAMITEGDIDPRGAPQPAPSDASILPQVQLKVIKKAVMKMEAGRGDYAKIRRDAVVITEAAGGYIEGESASRNDDGLTYAVITMRIPAAKFEGFMSEISALGEVVSTQVSTEDVSAEYVDMESRLRHLQAEEAFYLDLIGKAQTIQEMITIREHLSSIQQQKEQVQGRMNFLEQQAGYSTLTLSVDEVAPDDDGEGFWDAVADAFKSFGRGLRQLAIGLFYALPYILIAAVIGVLAWLLVRRSRKGRPEETPGS